MLNIVNSLCFSFLFVDIGILWRVKSTIYSWKVMYLQHVFCNLVDGNIFILNGMAVNCCGYSTYNIATTLSVSPHSMSCLCDRTTICIFPH